MAGLILFFAIAATAPAALGYGIYYKASALAQNPYYGGKLGLRICTALNIICPFGIINGVDWCFSTYAINNIVLALLGLIKIGKTGFRKSIKQSN